MRSPRSSLWVRAGPAAPRLVVPSVSSVWRGDTHTTHAHNTQSHARSHSTHSLVHTTHTHAHSHKTLTTHTHMHTHSHDTCTDSQHTLTQHTHAHSQTHNTHSYAHTQHNACTHTHTCACTHPHSHTDSSNTHSYAHTHDTHNTHARTCTLMHTHSYACAHAPENPGSAWTHHGTDPCQQGLKLAFPQSEGKLSPEVIQGQRPGAILELRTCSTAPTSQRVICR